MSFKINLSAIPGLMLLLTISISGFSQKTITGKITGGTPQEPVSGATITIKGSKTAFQTSNEGAFKLTVPNSSSVLIITAIGF